MPKIQIPSFTLKRHSDDLSNDNGGASRSLKKLNRPEEGPKGYIGFVEAKADEHTFRNVGPDERIGQGQFYAPNGGTSSKPSSLEHLSSFPDRKQSKEESEHLNGENVSGPEDLSFKTETSGSVEEHSESKVSHNRETQTNNGVKGGENGKVDHMQIWEKGKNVLEASKGVAADIRGSLFQLKERLIVKLAAVPIPADSLDNARQSMESIIREATQAAYGMTKDAVQRIRLRLVEILPSLSPNETKEIVDDVEREVLDMSEVANGETSSDKIASPGEQSKQGSISAATASAVSSDRPESLATASLFSMNINRIRAWTLRSRL